MKRTNIILLSALSLMGMGLQACSDDNSIFKGGENGDGVFFSLSVDNPEETTRASEEMPSQTGFVVFDNAELSLWASVSDMGEPTVDSLANRQTRAGDTHAIEITTDNIKNYENICIYSRSRLKDKDNGELIQDNVKIPILTGSDGKPYCHLEETWVSNEMTKFYHAYAAPDDAMITYTPSTEASNMRMDNTIQVPFRQEEQYDYVAAMAEVNEYPESGRIPLTFEHMLTEVCIDFTGFAWKDEHNVSYTFNNVTRVEIKNVSYKATIAHVARTDISNDDWNLWKAGSEKGTAYWDLTMPKNGDKLSFFLLPHDIGKWNEKKDNEFEYTYLDNVILKIWFQGIEEPKTAMLKAGNITRWKKGKKYTYKLRQGTSIFEVTPKEVYCDYKGTSGNLTITSSKDSENVGYSIEYSADQGKTWTTESWRLQNLGFSFSEWNKGYTITAQTAVTCSPSGHNERLRANPEVSGPYDLSTVGGTKTRSTANCYIVNAAGTYEFPLVYGNAVKNGVANTNAYTSAASGSGVLTTFTNHLGQGITNPYIYENEGCKKGQTYAVAEAELVWEDTKDLIQDVKLSDNKEMLVFKTADKGSISVGNAVVAVKDAKGQIMWSWHIWITDFEASAASDVEVQSIDYGNSNFDKYSYSFMGQNIGTMDLDTEEYAGREFQMRFTQKETGAQRIVRFIQHPFIKMKTPGDQPFFQWGRKDPMPPSSGKDYGIKLVPADGYEFKQSYKSTLQNGIKNPLTMYLTNRNENEDWCTTSYINLWDANAASIIGPSKYEYKIGVKTIYDPSPIGYMVPPNGAYSFATYQGYAASTITNINTPLTSFTEPKTYSGWLIYTKPMNGNVKDASSETILFAGTGYRYCYVENKGNIYYYNGLSWCWASTPEGNGQARVLYCAYTDAGDWRVDPSFGASRAYGCIVKPIREE